VNRAITRIVERVDARFDPVLVAVLYLLFIFMLGPWWGVYQFSNDEGLNLMLAALMEEGFELYSEIWNDQPPLLFYFLSIVHKLSGASVAAARVSVVVMSSILLACFYIVVTRVDGRSVASLATILLATSTLFIKYSVSVMAGIPVLMLFMIAVTLVPKNVARKKTLRLWLAGIVFGIALQTKFIITELIHAPPWTQHKNKQ